MPFLRTRQRVINGYQHIMACPIVRAWVLLVIVDFIVQIALQGVTFRDNNEAKNATGLCLSLAKVPAGLPLLKGDDLSMCDGIPGRKTVTCALISSAGKVPLTPSLSGPNSGFLAGFDLDTIRNITASGIERSITGRCAISLQWIHDIFRDNEAEDVATICFRFWLLIVSLLAVLQDSIPHLAVCMASHLLDVAWAGFRIKSTISLRQKYYKSVVNGVCGGQDILGNWWDRRLGHAAPLFGTNVIMFILLGALSIILFQRYAKISFSHVGVSAQITKMYKIALALMAFLQLAAFFAIMAAGMWIDRVSSGAITTLAGHIQIYRASSVIGAMLVPPWVIFGWWAIFREIRWAFTLFGALSLVFLAAWPTMFASTIFRYVFVTWSFFACVSITSLLFLIATTVTAIICRLHFGRGLGHYLRVEADLSSSGFPASFFANDSPHIRGGSPMSFDFDLLNSEKARNGSVEDDGEGPMHIRSYTLGPNEYSITTLPFELPANGPKASSMTTSRPPGTTSASIIRTLKKGNEKPLPTIEANSRSRPVSYVSHADGNNPKSTIFTRDKKRSWVQPPPEAYLQAPYKETRSRKDTPSMATQATDTTTNSDFQAVIAVARKNPVARATARTMSFRRTASPVDPVVPHEDRPSIDSETRIGKNVVPRQKQTFVGTVSGPSRVKYPPKPNEHGRI